MEDWFCNLYKRIVPRTHRNLIVHFSLQIVLPEEAKESLI